MNLAKLKWGEIIPVAKEIIRTFVERKTPPTLRAIHYALVSRNLIPNTRSAYQMLSKKLVEARKEGFVPWTWLADEVRDTEGGDRGRWNPERYAIRHIDWLFEQLLGYRLPQWLNQPYYVEVWIEKNTMRQTFNTWIGDMNVRIVPCRGYSSWTFLYEAAQRMLDAEEDNKEVKILYFGDFDPSGVDMDRFYVETLDFFGVTADLERYAVLENHISDFKLPSTPETAEERAKMQRDPRFGNWEHGFTRVELDAMFGLVPDEFESIVKGSVEGYFDEDIYRETLETQEEEQKVVRDTMQKYLDEKIKEEFGDEES